VKQDQVHSYYAQSITWAHSYLKCQVLTGFPAKSVIHLICPHFFNYFPFGCECHSVAQGEVRTKLRCGENVSGKGVQ